MKLELPAGGREKARRELGAESEVLRATNMARYIGIIALDAGGATDLARGCRARVPAREGVCGIPLNTEEVLPQMVALSPVNVVGSNRLAGYILHEQEQKYGHGASWPDRDEYCSTW
jgi:hypothetical protein